MVYIGLDISVNSTAMTVYNGNYRFYNYTSKSSNYTWIKKTTDIINYRFLDLKYKDTYSFSDKLVQRIMDYDMYSDMILKDIMSFSDDTISIGMEGYNYGLRTTDTIIDISELSSIIKLKILNEFKNCKLEIIPPKSVKINACNMAYRTTDSKKIVRNKMGIAGGSFDKHDMVNAFIDNENISNSLKDFIMDNAKIMSMKNVPKPFDDIIDSLFIMLTVKIDN